MNEKKKKVLIIIPARGGSKGIKNKNIRNFCGKPLIAHTILQAKALKRKGIDFRLIVSTENKKIAEISKKYGAKIPFLRPEEMAQDNSLVMDAILYTINRLAKEENYIPDYVMIFQTTGPLREMEDIYKCLNKIETRNTDAVATACPTFPLFYHLTKDNYFVLVNEPPRKFGQKNKLKGFRRQVFPKGYKLNGCINLIKTGVLLKEKTFFPKKTKAVIIDEWRSVDLDNPADFVLAELIYCNKEKIKNRIKNFRM